MLRQRDQKTRDQKPRDQKRESDPGGKNIIPEHTPLHSLCDLRAFRGRRVSAQDSGL